jgi:DNA-binding transcriptional regulator YdaS (Cro superfamily)
MSKALSRYRAKIGMTQGQLAALFKVKPPAVCKWEKKRVPAERVLDIARLTGIPKEELRPDLYPIEEPV